MVRFLMIRVPRRLRHQARISNMRAVCALYMNFCVSCTASAIIITSACTPKDHQLASMGSYIYMYLEMDGCQCSCTRPKSTYSTHGSGSSLKNLPLSCVQNSTPVQSALSYPHSLAIYLHNAEFISNHSRDLLSY